MLCKKQKELDDANNKAELAKWELNSIEYDFELLEESNGGLEDKLTEINGELRATEELADEYFDTIEKLESDIEQLEDNVEQLEDNVERLEDELSDYILLVD
ncbi:MAG: hypothetical protein HWN81_00200 [Candidatus Lokiarchaeota archaeon]|nr:hypothetical protein [Candidatus Lokiarchaeota archaeon]